MNDHYHQFTPKKNALKNRVILVSGAGGGIGRAAAKGFASLGATVILLGKTLEKLTLVYDEIVSCGYPTPSLAPLDLEMADEHAYAQVAEAIQSQYGHIDGLLNNAAILGDLAPIEHYKTKTWTKVMQINVNAQFFLTRAMLPLLKKSPTEASVIMTSSGVGRQGRAYWGAYAVSKFATEGFMQVLSDELINTSTVRVNSINPGATRTQMRALAYPAENPKNLRTPEDILGIYYFLISDESLNITGQSFNAQP